MENDVRSKWKFFKSQSSNTHIGKIDFKIKTVRRDKAGNFIMINGLIQEENITTINMETPRHIRLIMVTIIKGEIDSKTVIVWDVNTPPAPIDRLLRQKNK